MSQSKNLDVESGGLAECAWGDLLLRQLRIGGARPSLVVPAMVERVLVDVLSEDLPCITRWNDPHGRPFKRFEIPSSGETVESESLRGISESLRVTWIPDEHWDGECTVEVLDQLPRLRREIGNGEEVDDVPGEDTSAVSEWQRASNAVEALIDGHVDFVSHLFGGLTTPHAPTERWQGRIGSTCVRSVADTVEQWHDVGESDVPRYSLIVKLAETLPDVLSRVCRHPRRVLRRERQLQSLGRVREVDSGCLRWLARQPGTTVAQKAGSRQQTLSIIRVENTDTLENRVIRDLLVRAAQACHRYIREHSAKQDADGRVEQVRKFRQLLRRLLRDSPLATVSPLVGIPQPNYVLQMDPRYHMLWEAYLQLVRQQQLEDNVWRWRQRLFAEHIQMAVIAALQQFCDSTRTHGGDVIWQQEQNAGQFVDSRTALGPWWLKDDPDVCVDLVRGDQLGLHRMIPPTLASLGPDLVLVNRCPTRGRTLVGIWSLLDFDFGAQRSQDRFRTFEKSVANRVVDMPVRSLLIQPTIGDSMRAESTMPSTDHSRSLRFALPLQREFSSLVEHLRWALRLT